MCVSCQCDPRGAETERAQAQADTQSKQQVLNSINHITHLLHRQVHAASDQQHQSKQEQCCQMMQRVGCEEGLLAPPEEQRGQDEIGG